MYVTFVPRIGIHDDEALDREVEAYERRRVRGYIDI
jgi:hypothetical protein